jgi:hypothetical protein
MSDNATKPGRHSDFQNISDLLATRVAAAPDKTFLFSQPDGRQFTYAEFARAIDATAC